jgi:hypothetical protein
MEPRAVTGPEAAMGTTPTTPHRRRADSNGSATAHDLRQCARCGEQNQYCHGHTPIIPNASLDLPPRLPLRASAQSNGVARINLNCTQATALASRLLDALENNEDAAPVSPPPNYGEEISRIIADGLGLEQAVIAEGLGVRTRGGRGQGRGRGNRPQSVPDARRPAHAQQTQGPRSPRRVASPVPAGFEHNRGPAYIPFRIRNEHGGETPARYICAHLDTPNPFVEGRLSLNGPTYHSEIHAATIVDIDIPPPPITTDILRLLDTDYMGYDRVDEAIGEIGDRSLRAEVNRYRRLEHKHKAFQESIRRLEDQILRRTWRDTCALVDWRRRERWYVFRVQCRTIGKRSNCLHGLWNVGVCPEKGMMLRLHRSNLVSAVMTTRAESRISHGLLVVCIWLTDQSTGVALVSIVLHITCTCS